MENKGPKCAGARGGWRSQRGRPRDNTVVEKKLRETERKKKKRRGA